MNLKTSGKKKIFSKTISLFLLVGLLFWLFDSIVDYLFFYNNDFSNLLILDVPVHEAYVRSSFLLIMMILGILSSMMIYEHNLTLQENETRFRKALENFPFSIALIDQKAEPVYFNRKFTETFGYTDEDIPTMDKWWELAYPGEEYRKEVYSSWMDPCRSVMHGEKPYRSERKVSCKDGSVKDIEFHFTKTDGDQGMLIFNDVSSKKEAEKALFLDDSRLEALLELNNMIDSSIREITHFALEEAVKLTQSKVGYIGFLSENESLITMHSWSRNAMQMCEIKDRPIVYRVADTGIWGEPIRQRKAIIINDFSADHLRKKGYPEGHVSISSHLGVPVLDNDDIVVIAGVGNKEGDYDSSDVRQITLLMKGMWNL